MENEEDKGEKTVPEKEETDLLYKGAFEYFHKKDLFTEESFQVFKTRRDSSLIFHIEMLTRLDTGELLKTHTHYRVNKDWVPTYVVLDKYIGNTHIQEKFSLPIKATNIVYEFIDHKGKKTVEVPIPPRFQISTPNTCTKFLFLSSKKYDPTGRNFYNVLVTENNWEFTVAPLMKFVIMERISTTPVEITIKNRPLRATHFRAYAHQEDNKMLEAPINAFLSKFVNIPYLVEAPGDIRIQIKFLQEFEVTNWENFV